MLLIIKLSQKIFENIPTTLDAYRGFYKWKCEVQTSLYSSDAVCGKKKRYKDTDRLFGMKYCNFLLILERSGTLVYPLRFFESNISTQTFVFHKNPWPQ
jgi:hypothetical protein